MVQVINGRQLARQKEKELRSRVAALSKKGIKPQLVSLVMKGDRAGLIYTKLKQQTAKRIGTRIIKLEVDGKKTGELIRLIEKFNKDQLVQGIIVQRPGEIWRQWQNWSREKFDRWWQELVKAIKPKKDVDGLGIESGFLGATVKAVLLILDKVKARGKIVVVGSRGMVGKGLVAVLSQTGRSVVSAHASQPNLGQVTKTADVLVSATGRPNLIKANMIKPGAVVIDVGWPKGDIEFATVKNKAGVITPVPGGVGPLTVACLLENLVEAVYTQA
jgi:methylenetetrahydrofolate dehydrogenase (NADP+)/methenyltetrahydrofolate cyclohydrolase